MKAVIWTKYGAPDGLVLREVKKPSPKDNEILIKVKATTVTLGDCEMRSLNLPPAYKLPLRLYFGFKKPKRITLGQEFSGIIEKIGKNVKRFRIGDEIFGQTGITMGAYSEYFVLREKSIISFKPNNISFEEAACVPLGGLESLFFIKKSQVNSESKVLVIGAGGSIGTMGTQLFKLKGAKVTGVDTAKKFKTMKKAGADECIDYTKENYFESKNVYDIILDVVGKTPIKKGLNILKSNGLYLHANPKIYHMMFRRFLSCSENKKVIVKIDEESQQDLDYLKELLEKDKIKPIIDKIMPLEKIVEAHEYVEDGNKKGNLVIKI